VQEKLGITVPVDFQPVFNLTIIVSNLQLRAGYEYTSSIPADPYYAVVNIHNALIKCDYGHCQYHSDGYITE